MRRDFVGLLPRTNWAASFAWASCPASRPTAAAWSPPSSLPAPIGTQFYYVSNFTDYRFLQVFYPTRGILVWYDRDTRKLQPLPGADDPRYVQTNAVWSPDGKYLVFAAPRRKIHTRPTAKWPPTPTTRGSPDSVRSVPHPFQRRQRRQGRAHRRRLPERHEQQLPEDLARRALDRLRAGRNGLLMRPDSNSTSSRRRADRRAA
jgi:hypothetical protein